MQGEKIPLDATAGTGLPTTLNADVTAALYSTIKTSTRGYEPILNWVPPVVGARSMKLTLIDRQQPAGSYDRLVLITLRSKKLHCKRPAMDNVRVAVEDGHGFNVHFAQCIHFMEDTRGDCFVALRWYLETTNNFNYDSDTGAIRLALSPADRTDSYSVMPVSSILNGACIFAWEGYSWVVQSPREDKAYARTNQC